MSEIYNRRFETTLEGLRQRHLHRAPRVLDTGVGSETRISGRNVLLFCSNDYLGLAGHPALKAAARDAVDEWGTGAGASRLVSGNLSLYRDLESDLARFKHTEAALVFSSGYATHLGVIPVLAGREDFVYSDSLNHASIVDACRLSRAVLRVYPHGQVDTLERLMKEDAGRGNQLVVTDTVFSMDGDLAPLQELCGLCERFDALLLVDDAHGTGVLGSNGGGALEHLGIRSPTVVHMGTFSKALGGLGGFVAGSALLVDYLVNHTRTLIYSTGLPPATLASNRAALRVIESEPQRRLRLQNHVRVLRSGLRALGFPVPEDPTPIIPLQVGTAEKALSLAQFLWEEDIFVPAIRPPTVPEGTSRLRISVSATHGLNHVERLLEALRRYAGQAATCRVSEGCGGPP